MILKKLLRALRNFYRKALFFEKCRLCMKYMVKYGKAEASIKGRIKLLMSLAGGKSFESISTVQCVVKHSKVIIGDSINSRGSLFVFDRPASEDYWEIRDQWAEFHIAPDYERVDRWCFYQEKVSGSGSLLSLSNEDLCESLSKHMKSQIGLVSRYGKKVPVSWFLEKPYELLSDTKYLKVFSSSFLARVDALIASDKLWTAVPSVIEPWPRVSKSGLIFGDLSPVEFRSAPSLHDLCYMLMKYELYGGRSEGHKPFLPLVLEQVAKNYSEKSVCGGGGLVELAEQIKRLVTFDELMDSYVLMVLFHCYVKYHATGRFTRASPDHRLSIAVSRHASIFKKIESLVFW